jgi:hypothetical protein
MTAAEVVILIVAVIVGVVLVVRLAGGLSGSATVGDRSTRGRWRSRAERESIERDKDLWNYSPRGGHRQDPSELRKPPNEGGLL